MQSGKTDDAIPGGDGVNQRQKKKSSNSPTSVHDRLLNQAKQEKRPFNELLQYFAIERFLYRLSKSEHAGRFILKGALMLRAWNANETRPTMDIDVLGKTNNDEAELVNIIKEILIFPVDQDGLVFHPETVRSIRITEDADYEGLRINFQGKLGTARIYMQVDIGFGDIIIPGARMITLPSMLGFPPAELSAYSMESSIAEKFEAAVSLGQANSRMKDFFDIRILSRQFDFDGKVLAEAIRSTFKNRGTALTSEIEAFTKEFAQSKQTQWTAFRKKLEQDNIPESFAEVMEDVKAFIQPVTDAIIEHKKLSEKWSAPGPWK